MNNSFRNYITAKNVSRLASLLLIIFYFVPAFTFDIFFTYRLSAYTYTFEGHSFGGILYLLLPIAMLVMWCLKSVLKDRIAALICGCCAIADFLGWLLLISAARRAYYYSNAGLVFNILFLLIVIVANVLMFLGVVQPEACLLDRSAYGKAGNPFANMNNQMNGFQGQQPYQNMPQGQQPYQSTVQGQQMNVFQSAPQGQQMNTYQSAPQGQPAPGQAPAPVCPKCGRQVVVGDKFCMNCGNPIE